jgi:EAL domain-containing protein (putative c-di-GMP-specific phosphodiesterase class I)/DNA-binding NarL/FixJ family response regulator
MDRIRVLIADDEENVRDSLTTVLRSDPSLEVVGTATDAASAIDLAATARPDVALLDVRMPGGGPYAAREISRRCPPTRVVALSAFEDRDTVLTMIRAGAHSYVGKDATNDEILKAIHGTAAGNTELTPTAMDEVYRAFADAVGSTPRREDRDLQRRRIRRIIQRKAVDFACQPIADIDTLRVVGVEAFARFRTLPRRPPDRWFAEADALGLQLELELTSVSAAMDQLERVPAECYLALNVSPEVVASPSFREIVGGSSPGRIVLELSERTRLRDYDTLNDGLAELRAAGARVAVDDAGTGFSSFRHIVRIAPDLIKLDMSITQDLASDPPRQALVSSLLGFAFDVGAGVVAKGVESGRDLEALRWLGVRQAQGYYLARPSRIPEQGRAWGRTLFGRQTASPSPDHAA